MSCNTVCYRFISGLAQWIGRVTPNVVSVGSNPRSRIKNLQLGSTLMVSIYMNMYINLENVYKYTYTKGCHLIHICKINAFNIICR